MKTCWSCKGVVGDKDIFCPTCNIIQKMGRVSFFDIVSMPTEFELDLDMLEMRYLKQQMRIHPDKFTSKTKAEQLNALTWGAHLNDAYNTLKDPVARAVYLLDIEFSEPDVLNNYRTLSPQLMAYQFDVRERQMDGENVASLVSEVSAKADECYKELAQAFKNRHTANAIEKTVELRFLTKFLADLKKNK